MAKINIKSEIGFNDSEFVSYLRDGDTLAVTLKAWNGSTLTITFNEIIGVMDKGTWQIANVCQEDNPNGFFADCINIQYKQVPTTHEYKLYQLIDNDDTPTLEIVAKDIVIEISK